MEENEIQELVKQAQARRKKRRKRVLLLLLALLLLIGAGVAGYQVWLRTRPIPEDPLMGYFFDDEAVNGILAGSQEDVNRILSTVVDKGMYNVNIAANIIFGSGQGEGTANIQNIPANHYYCQVTIKLEDETEVYRSKGIKPGQYIEKIKLNQELNSGVYPATAVFTVTDPESLMNIATVNAKVTLYIIQ